MKPNNCAYGVGDHSYRMAGELAGLRQLVDAFYKNMTTFPESKHIRAMHPNDLTESRKKLVYFLSGWLGGPKLYAKHYGSIHIPAAHQHLPIGMKEREAWLFCMKKAIENQPYDTSFKVYLIEQLRVPAEKIRMVSSG